MKKTVYMLIAIAGSIATTALAGPVSLQNPIPGHNYMEDTGVKPATLSSDMVVRYLMNDIQACQRLGWGKAVIQEIPVTDDKGNPVYDKNGNFVKDFAVVDRVVFTREAWGDRPVREYTHGDLARIFMWECSKANSAGYVKFKSYNGAYKEQRLGRKYTESNRVSGDGNGKKLSHNDFAAFVQETISVWMSPYEVRKIVNKRTKETRVVRVIPPGHRSIAQCILEADKNFNQSPEPATRVRLTRNKDMGWTQHVRNTSWRKETEGVAKTDELGLPTTMFSTIGIRHLPAPRLEGLQAQVEREHRNRVRDCLEAAEIINPKCRFVMEWILKGYTVHQIIKGASIKYPDDWNYSETQFYRDCKTLSIKRDDLMPVTDHMTREQMLNAIDEIRAARKG